MGKARNGGVEAFIINQYRHIDRSKIQYDCIIDEDSTDKKFQCDIENLGGKIITIPPYQKPFAYHKALLEIFKKNNYPLVYSHLNTLSVFPLFAAWRANIPIRIAHSHSTAGRGEFLRNIMKYTLRPFSKIFPTHLCACTKFGGEWLFGKNTEKIIIWPSAIDIKRFVYNEAERNETRKFLKLENKFILGHAGRFEKQKNHSFLIDVFAEISRRRDDAVLLLAGEGSLMDEITQKVLRLGLNDRVIFLGSVHDMEKYYQAMDVFILPSLYEGLGLVAVEAQVSGLPVVCSSEVPTEAKICGNIKFLSLKKSASEWADETLKLCANHIRQDMSMAARENNYDVKIQGAKLSKWYCELLGV